jgi:catecholate siderophore receptor
MRPSVEPALSVRRTKLSLDVATLCLGSAAAIGSATGQTASVQQDNAVPQTVTVKGDRYRESGTDLDKLPTSIQDTPQSIDQVTHQAMLDQGTTRLQDALRYVPGVTMNSGEGGAHGDNVNLRGFATIDDFFVDGIRDPGSYTRDNFDVETVQVLQGPSSVLFGNGSAGGVINQVSKTPIESPVRNASIEFGTNALVRGTADVNEPLGDGMALRLAIMGEHSEVADRDDVQQKRWGFAPSLALGLGTSTTATLSFFHQEEDNVPDYGIPFLNGAPAPVPRNSFFGLLSQDMTQTNVNSLTASIHHDFGNGLTLSDTMRYANYWMNYRVTAPVFESDFAGGVPAPGTPLDQIEIYRDRPSSEGTATYLTNHTDLQAAFTTGPISHLLVTGVEFGRQTSDLVRFNNDVQGVDGTAPTPLLAPDPYESNSGRQTLIDGKPSSTADNVGVYAIDTIKLTSQLQLNLGIRFDRYDTSFNEPLSSDHYDKVDTAWSPRAALIYKPIDTATFYVSYAQSFDPVVSYLALAPSNSAAPPETAKTYEIGTKTDWLDGLLFVTAAAFETHLTNARISDPDDPTLQLQPGTNQRVRGIELGITGHLTEDWEITANYTFLDPTIRSASDPNAVGKVLPGAARNSANIWTVYDLNDDWKIGTGINYLGHRFADQDNTGNIPAYVLWNGMVEYQMTDQVSLQANLYNITDRLYYDGAYYSSPTENHVIPGAGRTLTLTANFTF